MFVWQCGSGSMLRRAGPRGRDEQRGWPQQLCHQAPGAGPGAAAGAEEQCCFLTAHELLNVLVCSARTQFLVPSAWLRVCQGVAFLPACVCRSAWLLACSHKLQQLSLALEKISYLCQTCAITRVVRVSPILWHCLMQSSSVKQDSVAPLPPPVLTQLWCIALFLCCLLLP